MKNGYLLFMFVFALAQYETDVMSAQATAGLSVERVLTAYEQSLSSITERVSFDAEREVIYNGAFRRKTKKAIEKRTVCRDGTRFGITLETMDFDDQQKVINHHYLRAVLTEDEARFYDTDFGKPPKFLSIDGDAKRLERVRIQLGFNLSDGRLLDGLALGSGGKSFVEVMREAQSLQLRKKMEIVDGHETYILDAKTKYGEHILWIDPKYGFNPRRIVIRKGVGDFRGNTRIGDQLPPLPPNVNPAVPWCATVMSEITVDSIEIQKVGEVLVPTAANIRQYEKFEDGQFTELISTHKRTNINFDPDFEAMGAFEIDVPNGTPVYFHDERGITGIKYEMVDGQVRAADSEGQRAHSHR